MAFNRNTFDEALTGVFGQACRNVVKDGRAHTVIHGFDKRGAVSVMILETYTEPDPDEAAEALARGIVMFPGPFRDRLPDLADLFARTGTVAAIHVAEAWKATYREDDDRAPSQREDRDEVLIVQGAWPAQVYERALLAQIVRDSAGTPSTRPYPDVMAGQFSVGWLAECLPDVRGRRPHPV